MKLRSLLIAAVAGVMLATPAVAASEVETGAAYLLYYYDHCNPKDIPPRMLAVGKILATDAGRAEVQKIFDDMMSKMPGVSPSTVQPIWCSMVKPTILNIVNNSPEIWRGN